MTYKLFQDKIVYFFIIPFILLSVALTTVVSGAIVEKIFFVIFIIVSIFLINRNLSKDVLLVSLGLLSFFTLLGLIHYIRYEELAHVMLPITFFMLFYLGLTFPYKNSFIYILLSVFFSMYFSYIYFNSFLAEIKNGRVYAEGFDINYLGFIFNYLFIIVVFYLKEYKKNIIMYGVLLLLLVLGLLTSSRGTLLAFIFGISLLLYGENKKIKLIFFTLITLMMVVYAFINYEMVEAMIDRFMNPSQRDKLVSYAMTFYFNGDLFNQLFGTTSNAYFNYAGKVTHNDQLRILINFGVINLIIYLLMYFLLMVKIYSYTKKQTISKESRIYAYFVLMLIFMYFFRGNFSNFFPALFIFYFIGSFYGMKQNSKEIQC